MICPICNGGTVARYRPFCSRRCAERDLGNWFNQRYSVPADDTADTEPDDDEDEVPRPSGDRVLH